METTILGLGFKVLAPACMNGGDRFERLGNYVLTFLMIAGSAR